MEISHNFLHWERGREKQLRTCDLETIWKNAFWYHLFNMLPLFLLFVIKADQKEYSLPVSSHLIQFPDLWEHFKIRCVCLIKANEKAISSQNNLNKQLCDCCCKIPQSIWTNWLRLQMSQELIPCQIWRTSQYSKDTCTGGTILPDLTDTAYTPTSAVVCR